jgi:N-acetylmuramic acid 6-phosphate etherase
MVAGTGSVAMSYEREGDHFNRTGRAGGWGYLLGDDGSGYDVGRQGVRVALQASDEIHLGQNGAEAYTTADPLVSRVFENFGIYNPLDPGAADLLEQVLAVESSPNQQQSSMAKRIAQVAKVVLDTFASSDKAKNIVENATQCLVDNLLSLLQRQDIKSSASSLILAGGLMQNVTFQKLLLDKISFAGREFRDFQIVNDPALVVAQYLLNKEIN